MAWTTPRTWTDGELVTKSIMDVHVRDNLSLVPHSIHKTADQSVTSSTVLVDDTHLQFAIAANEEWTFRFALATTGPGFLKVALNAPTSAAGWWTLLQTESASGNMQTNERVTATFVDGETEASQLTPDVVYIDGFVDNAGTAGTFKLRWAQFSSNGTATVLKKGSWMWRQRVA